MHCISDQCLPSVSYLACEACLARDQTICKFAHEERTMRPLQQLAASIKTRKIKPEKCWPWQGQCYSRRNGTETKRTKTVLMKLLNNESLAQSYRLGAEHNTTQLDAMRLERFNLRPAWRQATQSKSQTPRRLASSFLFSFASSLALSNCSPTMTALVIDLSSSYPRTEPNRAEPSGRPFRPFSGRRSSRVRECWPQVAAIIRSEFN